MSKRDGFIPEEDIEFERKIAQQKRESEELAKKLELERAEAEKKQRIEYERELQDKKIELMKLRQGVIDRSDTVKEVHPEKVKLSFFEWLSNVWYRSKWIILFAAFAIAALGYVFIKDITAVKPDLTVLAVVDNSAIYARTPEFEEFIKQYAEDINGDGEVSILIYNIITDYSDPTMVTSTQAQIMTQLQSGENVIIISDGSTSFQVHDFSDELSGDCVTEYGIKLNCELTREKLKWEAMPDDLYIALREPAKLLSTSKEDMIDNYNSALPTFMRIYEAINSSEK